MSATHAKTRSARTVTRMFFRIVCCWFTSQQHLRSYQDKYRIVTVHTHGDFRVLHHWVWWKLEILCLERESKPDLLTSGPVCELVYRLCFLMSSIYPRLPICTKLCHQHHDLLSHSVTLSWYWANQPLSYPNNVECLVRMWKVSILKYLIWFDQGSNPRCPNLPISQNWRRTL